MQAIFEAVQTWRSGLVGSIHITNSESTVVDDWIVTIETTFEIQTLWNADILERDGNRYTIKAKGWNSRLNPGESVSFGFVGHHATTDVPQVTVITEPAPYGAISSPRSSQSAVPTEQADIEFVDFAIAQSWWGGFTANLSFTYNGNEPLDRWQIEFVAPFEIGDLWHGELLSHNVEQGQNFYTISNASWNGTLLPGDAITIGFNGYGSSANEPSNYSFNGVSVGNVSNESITLDLPEKTSSPATVSSESITLDLPEKTSSPATVSSDLSIPADQSSLEQPLSRADESVAELEDQSASPPITANPSKTEDKNVVATKKNAASVYGQALQTSLLFYEAQRSGDLPDNNRITWRGDSALNDGADVGLDLTGGYYDAGDHVKFGFPMASSLTLLAWGGLEYRDAYKESKQLDELLDTVRWGTDYLLKAHVSDGQTTQALYAQVGDPTIDHQFWGRPEDMTMARPAYSIDPDNPGSDLAAETAAALAAASILFRSTDPSYADRLLDNAKQLYAFADTYRGRYSDSIPEVQDFYNSWSGYTDELAWGAAWLYQATRERPYLTQARQHYSSLNLDPDWTQSWDEKSYGTSILLAQSTGSQRYRRDVERWLDNWVAGEIQTTDGGLAWIDRWGSLRYSANTAFLAGIYSDTINDAEGRY
ncbi:MAG: glycoside hydrolase family 9 protein, partial [Cyanobacteria bacterium P01_H01_bin.105]